MTVLRLGWPILNQVAQQSLLGSPRALKADRLDAPAVSDESIRDHQQRARRFARKWGYADDADDFAQEAALKLVSGRRASLKQLFIDYLRSHYGRPGVRSRSDVNVETEIAGDPGEAGAGGDPGSGSVAWGRLRSLTANEAKVLDLTINQGLSRADISRQLGVTPSRISQILRQQIPAKTFAAKAHRARAPKPAPRYPLADVVKAHVIAVLVENDDNRTHAANDLGISLRGLRDKLHEYGLMGERRPADG